MQNERKKERNLRERDKTKLLKSFAPKERKNIKCDRRVFVFIFVFVLK